MEEKRRSQVSNSQPQTPSPPTTTTSLKSGEPPPPQPRRRNTKRKFTSSFSPSSSSSAPPPKRHAREAAAAAAASAAGGFPSSLLHNGPLTRARQMSDNNIAAVKNEDPTVAIGSSGRGIDGRDEVEVVMEVAEKKEENYEAIEAEIEMEFVSIRSRGSNSHVVPVTAGWFSWTDIHPLEKQTMRSFFNGKSESRTPEIYLEMRNWIMKRFHANPNVNIELKDLADLSVGDMDTRQEVMEFLDHWGLINYHPFPPSEPANMVDGPNTDVGRAEITDSVVDKLFQFEVEQSQSQIAPKGNASPLAMASGLFPESSIVEELIKQEGPSVEYHCNSCSADCSRKRYHCQKEADFDLCTECYNNGKFGSGMCPSDFILMEPGDASGASGGKWTDQETFLLLEALELFKENWNDIAEHVATKTKAQCILHFLQMPIEDGFLDDGDTNDAMEENAEPSSISNVVPVVPKDNTDVSEGKNGLVESGSAENSSDKLDSEPPESKSNRGEPELSIGKDDPQPSVGKTGADTSQPVSATKIVEDTKDERVSQGKNVSVVMMALMDAFDAVGSPLDPDDKLSFAEAGNPVMALAVFLSRLVEPDLAVASARSSLKSISKSSGLQLAARHCFLIEGPSDDKTDQTGSKSATCASFCQNLPERANLESKNKEVNLTNQCEKKSTLVRGGTSPKDDSIQKNGSTLGVGAELSSKKQDLCAEKQQDADEKSEKSVVKKSVEEKSLDLDKSNKDLSEVAEKLDNEKSALAEKPGETSAEQAAQKVLNESPNSQSDQLPINSKEQHDKAPPNSVNDSGNFNAVGESLECMATPKEVDTDSSEQHEKVVPNPVVGVGSETGVNKMEIDNPWVKKSMELKGAKDNPKVAKLKRAALAMLSAASVKAKLLANQEEDEIRQLAAQLIEKQLHKLEIKLGVFTELDNTIMRVRDQLDRSRQRLFNERAQIIASRLGFSGSSSRVLPINRMPPGLLNSMMWPPMNMEAQKPSMLRPVGTQTAPPTANVPAPPGVPGSSA